MSGLGILTSWLPMAFAIFLCEIKNMKFRRVVQTLTTVPNFISWVLVYAIAFCIFSTDGFVSSLMVNAGIWKEGVNMLMGGSHVWLQMLAWGLWKGIGWSAIIYIAAISGIDQQLYEAATVDVQDVPENVEYYRAEPDPDILCITVNVDCKYLKQWYGSVFSI